jgi:hypothetical protein
VAVKDRILNYMRLASSCALLAVLSSAPAGFLWRMFCHMRFFFESSFFPKKSQPPTIFKKLPTAIYFYFSWV